jgi:hypothetical protein
MRGDDEDLPVWVPVGAGRLALWHRPKLRAIPLLKETGCTAILTLQSEREKARDVGDAVRAAGMAWHWAPLPNGHPPTGELRAVLAGVLQDVARGILAGDSVLVHCSAGIHRTGAAAYGVLQLVGQSPEDAVATIEKCRALTHDGLLAERRTWVDEIIAGLPHRAGHGEGVG